MADEEVGWFDRAQGLDSGGRSRLDEALGQLLIGEEPENWKCLWNHGQPLQALLLRG